MGQVFYNPEKGIYTDQYGNPLKQQPNQKSVEKKDLVYAPDLNAAYGRSDQALDDYFASIKAPKSVGDLTSDLKKVGAYDGFDWSNPADSYNAPTFQNNVDMERTSFDVADIEPMAGEIYQNKIGQSKKRVSKQFQDARSQVLDEVYRNRNRPEQAAALLAEMGVQEAEQAQEAEQNILSEQAQQKLGLADSTRNLKLQAAQSAAQERGTAASFKQAQDQYAYEQALAGEQFKTGLNQWFQEQQAAEEQAKYQSAYSYAQDLGQAKLNQYETDRAADMDYYNAKLQGQQAAAQQFAQASTYTTNLSEDERSKARENSQVKNSQYKMPNTYNTTKTNVRYSTPRGIYG